MEPLYIQTRQEKFHTLSQYVNFTDIALIITRSLNIWFGDMREYVKLVK